jgi:hypothetical protein
MWQDIGYRIAIFVLGLAPVALVVAFFFAK